MAKLTLEEKKLEKIRQQLFGKEQPVAKSPKTGTSTKIFVETETKAHPISTIHTAEAAFLKQDLVKVLLLSIFLIGTQFVLYFLSLKGIVHLTVFHIL